jgi:hypothetical protein
VVDLSDAGTAVVNVTAADSKGGECHDVDNLRDPNSAMAVRYGYFIYYGRPDSCSSRNCNYSCTG